MASELAGLATQPYDYKAKLVLIGDSVVGKSQILSRFAEDRFSLSFVTTIGIDFRIRNLNVGDKRVKAQIWDLAGQERFRPIINAYLSGPNGAMLVYDITKPESFDHIPHWLEELRKRADKNIVIALVGNKCDLESQRAVSFRDAKQFAENEGLFFFETSALDGTNIESAFLTLLTAILTNMPEKQLVAGKEQVDNNPEFLKGEKIEIDRGKIKWKSLRDIQTTSCLDGVVLWLLSCRQSRSAKQLKRSFELLKLKAECLFDVRSDLEEKITKELILGKKPTKEIRIWLTKVEEIESQVRGMLKFEQKGSGINISLHERLMNLLNEIVICLEKSPLQQSQIVDLPSEKTKRNARRRRAKLQGKTKIEGRAKLQGKTKIEGVPDESGISPAQRKETAQDKEMRQPQEVETLIAPSVDLSIPVLEFEKTQMQWQWESPKDQTVSAAGLEGSITPALSDEVEAQSVASKDSSETTAIIPHQKIEISRHHENISDLIAFEAEEISSMPEIEILSIYESETQSISSESQEVNPDGSNREIIFMRSAEPIDQAEIEHHHPTHGGSLSPEPRRILRRTIQDNVQNVLRCINDIKTKRIGIYGNGGIGKTTVLKAFISHPEPKIMFDLIVWVTVSRYWTTRKIQNEIVRQLALSPIYSDTDSGIAERLFQALRGRKFLLLLDDVWDWIDLDLVGIPDNSQETGSKIIISTRSVDVCHVMDADAEIRVEGLAWEEAWELFCEQVGGIVESPDINPFARGIVKECSGLPLAIIVTGRALRDENDVLVWKHALQEFSLPSSTAINGTETVIQQLKFCYRRLKSRETKSFFLYCALFPEDHEVNVSELVEYCIQEGLVAADLEDAQKKGHDTIEILVNVALLEISEDGLSIRMHDVIRDLALQVLSSDPKGCQFLVGADLRLAQTTNVENSSVNFEKPELSLSEGHHFLLRAGARLTEPPLEKEWQNAKIIFLMDNDISRLPEMPRCPNLLTLFLQRNYLLRVMPMSFFDYMPSLQVLNLSNTRIKSLPKSLFRLMSLQILILRNCERLLILPSEVGALKNLEILDLRGTEIDKLPDELGELVYLRHFEVSFYGTTNRSENVRLPPELVRQGVISRLRTLKKLGIVVQPGDQRWTRSVESIVVELGSLTRLTALSFYFPEVELLRLFLELSPSWNVKDLTEFKFVVGDDVKRIVARVPEEVEFDYGRRGQCLRFVNGDTIPDSILEVLTRTTAFYLDHHLNISSLSDFGLSSINGLEFCVLRECPAMHTIIASKDTTDVAFPFLGRLSIHYMWNLKNLWEGTLPYGSFAWLKILSVHMCPKLGFVFSYSMLQYAYNLEELVVEDCPSIKEIVTEDEAFNSCIFVLPCLKRLILHYVPALVNIWKGRWPPLEHISFYNCPNLKNIGMDPKLKHTLKEIKGEKTWWDALEWEETTLFLHLQSRFIDISDDNL